MKDISSESQMTFFFIFCCVCVHMLENGWCVLCMWVVWWVCGMVFVCGWYMYVYVDVCDMVCVVRCVCVGYGVCMWYVCV